MRARAILGPGLVVAGLCFASVAAFTQGATPQAQPDVPKGTGFIMGKVVDASGARPIANAQVSITGTIITTVVSANGQVMPSTMTLPTTPSGSSSAPRQLLTNGEGRFMFRDLPRGRYAVRATAGGYLSGATGMTRPGGAAQSIELSTDDDKVSDAVVRMWKGAVVSGRVLDEAGEPVIGQSVRVFRRTNLNGKPRLGSAGTSTTDDRGIYRAANLTPGDYVVGVLTTAQSMPAATADAYRQMVSSGTSPTTSDMYKDLSSSGAPSPSLTGHRVGDFVLSAGAAGGRGGSGAGPALPAPADDGKVLIYPTTFFPAARIASQATAVTLASGEERTNVDLRLKLTPTVRVSGTVVGPDGVGKNLGVRLLPAGADEFTSELSMEAATTATDANGAFTFLGVTPGQYKLKVLRVPRPIYASSPMTMVEVSGPNGMMMSMGSSGGPSSQTIPPEPTLWGIASVVVAEADVRDLSVQLRTGVKLTGRLEFEGKAERPAPEQLQRTSLSVSSTEQGSVLQNPASRVEGDGHFTTGGFVPGSYQVNAFIPPPTPARPGQLPVSWTLKSVTLGGRAVDGLLEVGQDAMPEIVLTYTDQSTELSGSVVDAKGQPDKNAELFAFPADSQAWRQGVIGTTRVRNTRSSQKGTFLIIGLAPGDYFVAAVTPESVNDWQDPKFLDAVSRGATRVTLADGGKQTVSLTTKAVR